MFRRNRLVLSLLALLAGAAPSQAVTWDVNVASFAFTPAEITIAPGDIVRWNWVSGSHTTTSGSPCTADGLWSAAISMSNPTFSYTFDDPGSFPYFCIPHCAMGMTGVVNVVPLNAAKRRVDVLDFQFSPRLLTIAAGDTVEWVWRSGFHTTTSGEACTGDGLWDAPITEDDPTFTYVFNEGGIFPYFCIPHCDMEMDGVITVQRNPTDAGDDIASVRGDLSLVVGPNPGDGARRLSVTLVREERVKVDIIDAAGRTIAVLADGAFAPGAHEFLWNGLGASSERVPSGVYFARIATGTGTVSSPIVVLK